MSRILPHPTIPNDVQSVEVLVDCTVATQDHLTTTLTSTELLVRWMQLTNNPSGLGAIQI